MAQNIYDDEAFFAAYADLRRSVHGLAGAPEWPTLRNMLPVVSGRRVLDLGCGYGWFCRWAASEGARQVVGIDISSRMLDRARSETSSDRIDYRQSDLDQVHLDDERYDLVYSSLALHYLDDLDRLFGVVSACLGDRGAFVFSVEHPVVTAPTSPAFVQSSDGRQVWPLDGYFDEGERITDWLAPGVRKVHRTIETYLTSLIGEGFVVKHLVEWKPSPEQITENPEWGVERQRPAFLLVSAGV